MEDLYAIYLPRFVASSRARLERARASLGGDHEATTKLAAELHAIAGDAGLLGLKAIAQLASACEQAVRRAAEQSELTTKLEELARSIEDLQADRR